MVFLWRFCLFVSFFDGNQQANTSTVKVASTDLSQEKTQEFNQLAISSRAKKTAKIVR
jgi:hypothetical protein